MDLKIFKLLIFSALLASAFSSCSITGIHFNIHNPKRASKNPDFDAETILLGEPTPIRNNFDVTFYGLDIHIDENKKRLGGWVEIRATALNDLDSVQLDLDKPLSITELRWDSRNGQSLNYSRKYRAVFIKLPHRMLKGQNFSLHVKYEGKPVIAKRPPWRGGLVWKKDKQHQPWIGVACESEGASIWFPCKDVTSDEPDSASMRFTIPDNGLFVVSNGRLMGTESGENTKSFKWKVSYPINLYDITFYEGNFEEIDDTLKGINSKILYLTHYALKPHVEMAREHFREVKNEIRVYEEIYGEYPWYNDGFKLVESPYEGMEHQTAIAYGNGFKNDLYKKEDYIILHETGHEWFGNAVSAADFADIWLQEGITTYGEELYLEKMYGEDIATRHLWTYRYFIQNRRAMAGPADRRYFSYKNGDVYVKAAWMLHTLRNDIGNDSVFLAILRTFYTENKYKVTDSKKFIETVNRISGKDYQWFFNQYLYFNEVPFLETFWLQNYIYFRWTNSVKGFNKLGIDFSLADTPRKFRIYPDSQVQRLQISENRELAAFLCKWNTNKSLIGFRQNKHLEQIYMKEQSKKSIK